ncbi:MAG: hypothetical protein WBA41_09695 [Rivularia sp. (in: cyanobacteria)]
MIKLQVVRAVSAIAFLDCFVQFFPNLASGGFECLTEVNRSRITP